MNMNRNKITLEDLKNSTLIPVMLVPERIPVSLATVRAWIFQGKLPVVRIGRKVFIRKEVLEKIEIGGLDAVSEESISCLPPSNYLGGACD
jgi:excisionase family DNA binding protein